MPKNDSQKRRLLLVRKLLLERTDSDNGLTLKDILSTLEDEGIKADRRAIYDDIASLIDDGMDIEKFSSGKNTDYRVVSRDFELAELKLLSDAVRSAHFLTQKKSSALIRKLASLSGPSEAKIIKREIYMLDKFRSENEQIYYVLDAIQTAIERNKQISFLYFEYNCKKEKIYRHNGDRYKVSPWGVIFSDGNYYMVAYDSSFGGMKHYRIDKMEKTSLLPDGRLGRDLGENMDLSEYAKKMFGMFGGESTLVTLRAQNRLCGILFDRFGKDITLISDDTDHFLVSVKVNVSPQFLGWIMSFGSALTITSPENVVREYKALAKQISEE